MDQIVKPDARLQVFVYGPHVWRDCVVVRKSSYQHAHPRAETFYDYIFDPLPTGGDSQGGAAPVSAFRERQA